MKRYNNREDINEEQAIYSTECYYGEDDDYRENGGCDYQYNNNSNYKSSEENYCTLEDNYRGNSCRNYNNEEVNGNYVDLELYPEDLEVKADITVKRRNSVKVWGEVKDSMGVPLCNVMVKIMKHVKYNNGNKLINIATTKTDNRGYYQFKLQLSEQCEKYRVALNDCD